MTKKPTAKTSAARKSTGRSVVSMSDKELAKEMGRLTTVIALQRRAADAEPAQQRIDEIALELERRGYYAD